MDILKYAKAGFRRQAESILNLQLGQGFEKSVKTLIACKSKVICSGIGKAGHVAATFASKLCSNGTPAVFLDPIDCDHGTFGAIQPQDVIVCISNSGKTNELIRFLKHIRTFDIGPIITITSRQDSPVGLLSDLVIPTGELKEICPIGLTPTTSTIVQHCITDLLTICVAKINELNPQQYSQYHHGGYLGSRAKEM